MDINVPDNTINKGEPAHARLAAASVFHAVHMPHALRSVSTPLPAQHKQPCNFPANSLCSPRPVSWTQWASSGAWRCWRRRTATCARSCSRWAGQGRASCCALPLKSCTSDGSLPNMAVADCTQVKRTVHSLHGVSLRAHVRPASPTVQAQPTPLPAGAEAEQGEVGGGTGPRHARCGRRQPHAHLVRRDCAVLCCAVLCCAVVGSRDGSRDTSELLCAMPPCLPALPKPRLCVQPNRLTGTAHLPLPAPFPGTPTSPIWMWACCSPAGWGTWTWTDLWVSFSCSWGRARPAARWMLGLRVLARGRSLLLSKAPMFAATRL